MPSFRLLDKSTTCASDKEVYIEALRELQLRASNLFSQVRQLCTTRRRTFFARDPAALFPGSPHLAEVKSHYSQLVPGWYADTNLSNKQKERVLMYACAVAGIEYLEAFEVRFEAGHYSPLSRGEATRLADELLEELRRI